MAEKILKTRIKNGYKTYDEWSLQNPILLKGEVVICEKTIGTNSSSVLIKVGDGIKNFNDLPFVSAPNPQKISFIGATKIEYDGSVGQTVSIPICGGTPEEIQKAVDNYLDRNPVQNKILWEE